MNGASIECCLVVEKMADDDGKRILLLRRMARSARKSLTQEPRDSTRSIEKDVGK